MKDSEFNILKKRALHSVGIHKKFKNGTFKFDKNLMKELFDDSKLEEENSECNCNDKNNDYNSKVRIGKNYQVLYIPEINKEIGNNFKFPLIFIFFFILLSYYFNFNLDSFKIF